MSYALFVVTKMFCKRAALFAVLSVMLLVLGPLAFYELMRFAMGPHIKGITLQPIHYHFAFLGVSWLLFITVGLHALQGTQKVIFGLPVSSISIFSWSVFSTEAIYILLNLVTNGFYRIAFFDENWLTDYWPLWGPTLFFATLIMVGHCIFWNMRARSIMRLCFWISFVIAMFWWFISRYYPEGFAQRLIPWNQVTLSELITMQLVFVVAWIVGFSSFTQVRCGAAVPSLPWERVKSWSSQLMNGSLTSETQIPSSVSKGLAHLHWRDSCYLTLLLAGCVAFLTFVANLIAISQMAQFDFNNQGFNGNPFVVTTVASLYFSFVLIALPGVGLSNKTMLEMRQYLAIIPLSDQAFSAILIRNLIKSISLVLFLIVVLGFLLSNFIACLYFGLDLIRAYWAWCLNHNPNLMLISPLLFIALYWAGVANSISVLWTGRKKFMFSVFLAFFGCFVFGMFTVNLLIPKSFQTAVMQTGAMFLACCILIGTITAYFAAFRKKLITSTTVKNAVLFCLIVPMLFWGFWNTDQVNGRLFLSSLFVMAVTPFATIPLAVYWNRHR